MPRRVNPEFRPSLSSKSLAGFSGGIRPRPSSTEAPKLGLLEKLQQAEAKLGSLRDTKQGKWKLTDLRAKQQFLDTNDTRYWIAICFESSQQKDAFLHRFGLYRKDEDQYFSGIEVSEALGLTLAPDSRSFHTLPVNRRWARHALPVRKATKTSSRRGR